MICRWCERRFLMNVLYASSKVDCFTCIWATCLPACLPTYHPTYLSLYQAYPPGLRTSSTYIKSIHIIITFSASRHTCLLSNTTLSVRTPHTHIPGLPSSHKAISSTYAHTKQACTSTALPVSFWSKCVKGYDWSTTWLTFVGRCFLFIWFTKKVTVNASHTESQPVTNDYSRSSVFYRIRSNYTDAVGRRWT